MRMPERLKEKLIVFFFQVAILPALFVGLTFLYFIGADSALSTGNTTLYNVMIPCSLLMFSLTQTSQGSGLSLTNSQKIHASNFFLFGGLVMMLNWLIPVFVGIPYATATLFQHSYFDLVVGGGMVGIFLFLLGFFSMASSTVGSKVHREETKTMTYTFVPTASRDDLPYKWLSFPSSANCPDSGQSK